MQKEKVKMRDHYTPQYYLKGFVDSEEKIWVYEMGKIAPFRTVVKNVGQETGFYSPQIETFLADQIEGPANPIIEKVRNRQAISIQEKACLTDYIVSFVKRVPRGAERVRERAPEIAADVFSEFRFELMEMQVEQELKERYLEKADALFQYYSKESKDFWLSLIPPGESSSIVYAIATMTWVFLTHDGPPVFLTSDNPVFFFDGIGVGNPDSELSFPISSNIALWATWRRNFGDCSFAPIYPFAYREINRRTAVNATRYVFHALDEPWIPRFIIKRHRLNYMRG